MKVIEVKIIAAASYFGLVSQRVEEIAAAFDVNTRTVRRWACHELWEQTLDVLKYEGDRSFEQQRNRDVQRDTGGLYDATKAAYQQAILRGDPVSRLARIASEVSGVDVRKVRDWAKRYNWRETMKE